MIEDEDMLVDLSDPTVTAPPPLVTVTLERESLDARWGFLTYNHRFPLTIGKAEDHVAHLLRKGDVIVSVNGTTPRTFDEAAVVMRQVQRRLVLTIDRSGSGATTAVPVAANVVHQQRRSAESASSALGAEGSLLSEVPQSTSPFAASDIQSQTADVASVVRPRPIVLNPIRSNFDLVLNHLQRPPRVAVYDRSTCPFDASQGFTEDFHDFVQNFLTEQALAAGAPNKDVRFDAISAVLGIGISRLPNELVKDVSVRGSEFIKKRDASQVGSHERERFAAQMNALCGAVQTAKQQRRETRKRLREERAAVVAAAKESLAAYKELCSSDASDIPLTNFSSQNWNSQTLRLQQAFMRQHASSGSAQGAGLFAPTMSLPLPVPQVVMLPTEGTPASDVDSSFATNVSSGATPSGSGDAMHHISRKKRRRIRQQAVMKTAKEVVASLGALALPAQLAALTSGVPGALNTAPTNIHNLPTPDEM